MSVTKFGVQLFIFQLIMRLFLARNILKTSTSEHSSNHTKAVVDVVKSCYRLKVTTIGLAGNSSYSLIDALSCVEDLPVVLLDNTRQLVNRGRVSRKKRSKLGVFAIMSSSSNELEGILRSIKNSQWWNHMAYFYILDLPVNKENGCWKAYEFLWIAWKMNLLNAKFMCTDGRKGRFIYRFNPYTSDAPKPWKLETLYRGINNHPWALLVREYHMDPNVCEELDFDTTTDLGGYEIRLTMKARPPFSTVDIHKTGLDSLGGTDAPIVRTIFHALNASAKIIIHGINEPMGNVDNEGKGDGVLKDTADGTSDILFNLMEITLVAGSASIYPIYSTGLYVMTQDRGHASQLSKILSVIDTSSRIGCCLVCLITMIFLKCFLQQAPLTIILNIFRLICNSCLLKLPDNLPSRIYLSCLFFFMVTMQGIYQGKLASLLSTPVSLPNINTMQQLVESGYTVYGNTLLRRYFSGPGFEGRYIALEDINCTTKVLRDSLAACAGSRLTLLHEAAKSNLHLSSNSIANLHFTWVIREDWPLEQRFNVIAQKLVDANYYTYFLENNFERFLRVIDEAKNGDQTSKVFTLGDLSFAFAILGFGLNCATISFIVEMIIERVRSRVVEIRARLRGRSE